MVVFPSRVDFDSWEKLGNPGWGWDAMAPCFRKFHTYTEPPAQLREDLMLGYMDTSAQGSDGPLHVSFGSGVGMPPFNVAWPRAWAAIHGEMQGDPVTGTATGAFNNAASMNPLTMERSHAGNAYLSDEVTARPNLRVVTEAHVTKILLVKTQDGSAVVKATGVEFTSRDGETRRVHARREVVLAAGALHTPKLLELSGIGSKDLLARHGIACHVDNPGVGENVQDHGFVPYSWEVADPLTSADQLRNPDVAKAMMEAYTTAKAGPFTLHTLSSAFLPLMSMGGDDDDGDDGDDGLAPGGSPAAVLRSLVEQYGGDDDDDDATAPGPASSRKQQFAVLRDQLAAADHCSAQYTLAPFQITPQAGPSPQQVFGMKEDGYYVSMVAVLNHPFSRGRTHIRSADPRDPPSYDPRAVTHPLDLELHARHALFLETLRDAAPLRALFRPGGRRLHSGGRRVETLDQAKETVREGYTPHYHVCGSAAMLPRDEGGVVDCELRVYGVEGLRVVDASIFPLIPRGNIQTDVYAVAEKAAEILTRAYAK